MCDDVLRRVVFLWCGAFGVVLLLTELQRDSVLFEQLQVPSQPSARAVALLVLGSTCLAAAPMKQLLTAAPADCDGPVKRAATVHTRWGFAVVGVVMLVAAWNTQRLTARTNLLRQLAREVKTQKQKAALGIGEDVVLI